MRLIIENAIQALVNFLCGRFECRQRGSMSLDIWCQRCLFAHLEVHVDNFVWECWELIAETHCVNTSLLKTKATYWILFVIYFGSIRFCLRVVEHVTYIRKKMLNVTLSQLSTGHTYSCGKLMGIELGLDLMVNDLVVGPLQWHVHIILSTGYDLQFRYKWNENQSLVLVWVIQKFDSSIFISHYQSDSDIHTVDLCISHYIKYIYYVCHIWHQHQQQIPETPTSLIDFSRYLDENIPSSCRVNRTSTQHSQSIAPTKLCINWTEVLDSTFWPGARC